MEQPVEEEQTLGELFRFCALECQNLEKGKKGEVELHEVQSNIRRCLMKVNSLGLFSPNEDKDDILTSHLKFLCLRYFLGLCCMNYRQGDRLTNVKLAMENFKKFVSTCCDKELLEDDIRKSSEQLDMADGHRQLSRAEKIQQYKRVKEIKNRIESLKESLGATGKNSDASEGPNEEIERELSILSINLNTLNSLQHYSTLKKELEILEFAKDAGDSLPKESEEDVRQKEEVLMSLKKAAISLKGNRERIAEGVFRPSHRLPTMTVEEYGEIEYQRMKEAEAQQSLQKSSNHSCSDLDDCENEECIKKEREWDDWKDDNPKGWGNSNLRPCA